MEIKKRIEEFKQKFPEIINIAVVNKKRLMINIPKEQLLKLTKYIFENLGCRYIIVSAMDSKEGYEIIYHYSDDNSGWIFNLNVMLPKDKPEVESVTSIVYGAEWIEREIMDILGIKFLNHPKPERFLMAESWPKDEYPFRRNFKQEKK